MKFIIGDKMRYLLYFVIFLCVIQVIMSGSMLRVNPAFALETEKGEEKHKKLLSRIDFGNTYILGQTIKSGAVYLLQRKKSEIRSMLNVREDFRKEILEDFEMKDKKMKQD